MVTLPLLVTLGDPAGIGPEVAAKMIATTPSPDPVVLVGCRWALARAADACRLELPTVPGLGALSDGANGLAPGYHLLDLGIEEPGDFQFGTVSEAAGEVAVQSVERAARACLDGAAAAMVTCPINKEAIHAAGYVDDIGHQEILVRLAGVDWTATMLMTPGLRVAHLSTHKSLIEAARYVTRANVLSKVTLTHQSLVQWGLGSPRIAVAALNPHGGEGGLLGREEIDEIAPAVADARDAGMDVTGPIPADSIFYRAIGGEFDVVLALYHDQGHIAIKVHDFRQSTTVTLGIPFVRTSVDHGTAFDIAGRGVADATSLLAAVDTARSLVSGSLGSGPD